MTTKVLHYMPDHALLAEDTERSPKIDDANEDLTPRLGTPFAKSEKPGKRPGAEFDTQIDGTNALSVVNALGEGSTASQFHVSHDTVIPIQQPKSELTREDLYVLCQEVHTALRCIIEVERHTGIVRSDRSLRCERIQLGLEIAVADNRLKDDDKGAMFSNIYIRRKFDTVNMLESRTKRTKVDETQERKSDTSKNK
ncbi:hypothetical protein H4582DRAFT_2064094 [Lactarius indigo]|nr:hypothetical protein H4582DRAFT_2064094 [Lactarius indigo]